MKVAAERSSSGFQTCESKPTKHNPILALGNISFLHTPCSCCSLSVSHINSFISDPRLLSSTSMHQTVMGQIANFNVEQNS